MNKSLFRGSRTRRFLRQQQSGAELKKNEKVIFSRHCAFVCEYCTLFYTSFYQADQQTFEQTLIDPMTLRFKQNVEWQLESHYSLINLAFNFADGAQNIPLEYI